MRLNIRPSNAALLVGIIFSVISNYGVAILANQQIQPNIVFVLFDDFGYCQPASYRANSEFKTPNFDRLTRDGMRFMDAHSAAANCTPTRYGLLTGRYPCRIGQFGVLKTYSPPIIPVGRPTVASFLRSNGYHTACIGKWHLGLNWVDGQPGTENEVPVGSRHTDGPNALGFDYFFGYTHARNIGSIIEQDRVVANVKAIENQPLMIGHAISYIEQRAATKQPFFLYFPMCPPHTPVAPAEEYLGKSEVVGKESEYGDWVYQGDDMLGQILNALERTGQASNTLVIATGDNGAAGRPYAPLRESKSSIYEGGHREPFVARWPGHVTPNSVCHQTICLNDLFATCADILAKPMPDNCAEDSFSILPYLEGKTSSPVREATVHQAPGGLAIQKADWKLVFHRNGERELFNLKDDLGETSNVAAGHDEIISEMTNLMQSYIDQGRSRPGTVQKNEFNLTLSFGNGGARRRQSKKEQ
ncbi:MAG: arylsulfatase [Planctomycetales bacterium]|nr:arylsulfatase [Planctomycetales bacterium]